MTHIWSFLSFLYAQYRMRLVAVVITCIFGSLLEGVGVIMLLPLLSLVGIGAQDSHALWLKDIFLALGLSLSLEVVLLTIFLIFCVHGMIYWVNNWLMNSTEHDITMFTREKVFRSVLHADWSFFLKRDMGQFSNIVIKESERVGAAFTCLTLCMSASSLILIYMVSAFQLNAKMAAVVMATGALLVIVFKSQSKRNKEAGHQITVFSDQFVGFLQECLIAAKFIKASSLEAQSQNLFRERVLKLRNAWVQSTMNSVKIRALGEPISVGLLCICIYFGVKFWNTEGPSLLVLLFIFMRTSPRVTELQRMWNLFLLQLPAFERINQELIDSEKSIVKNQLKTKEVFGFESLEFRNVDFSYHSDTPILNKIDFKIQRGQMIGIAGPSGSGKSTLVDLMLGLLEPSDGQVLLNGETLQNVRLEQFREKISYVTQETLLFHDTLLNNIRWIKPQATFEEVKIAVENAQCSQFITSSHAGFETMIGDRGMKISGGQKQRIAIARALLRQPEVLILDEATSALDKQTESDIMATIEKLKGKITIVVISHRPSTLNNCDFVYRLNKGSGNLLKPVELSLGSL